MRHHLSANHNRSAPMRLHALPAYRSVTTWRTIDSGRDSGLVGARVQVRVQVERIFIISPQFPRGNFTSRLSGDLNGNTCSSIRSMPWNPHSLPAPAGATADRRVSFLLTYKIDKSDKTQKREDGSDTESPVRAQSYLRHVFFVNIQPGRSRHR